MFCQDMAQTAMKFHCHCLVFKLESLIDFENELNQSCQGFYIKLSRKFFILITHDSCFSHRSWPNYVNNHQRSELQHWLGWKMSHFDLTMVCKHIYFMFSVFLQKFPYLNSVKECYIGVEDTYANPRTLSFPDLSEVFDTVKLELN